jgi:hypothetical protein
MCAVASRGLYHGMGPDELNAEGIGFSLFEMQTLAALVGRVIAEEHERRDAALTPSIVRSTPVFAGEAETAAGESAQEYEPRIRSSEHRALADVAPSRADEPRSRADEHRAPARIRLAGAPAGA